MDSDTQFKENYALTLLHNTIEIDTLQSFNSNAKSRL